MNPNQLQLPFYLRVTIKLILAILIVYVMIVAKDVLMPLTLAVFLTFLLLPISRWLERLKFPSWLAIVISIVLAVAVILGFISVFGSQLYAFSAQWPELKVKFIQKLEALLHYFETKTGVSQEQQIAWLQAQFEKSAQSGGEYVLSFFSATGTFVANLALIPIYVFFLTYFKEKYKNFVAIVAHADEQHERILEIIRKIASVCQNYIKGIMLDVLILAVLNAIGFALLGLQHPILFGVLAAVLNIIPYVGVLVGSILPVALALLTHDNSWVAAGALGVCITVQFLDNNFITPYVVGSSVSINPLTATIALIIFASIWGLMGMVLCLPLTGMLKVVCDNVEPLKPYGYLLGEEIDYTKQEKIQDKVISKFKQTMLSGKK